jgi:cytochrome c oxidase assembly protein subunit 15
MKNRFRFWIGLSIVLVYGVIAAGAIVRMTGSGMGCPDWPKCFGYLIPPTERAQLDWQASHDYQTGQVIIVMEELRVANKVFRSSEQYNEANWEQYSQHDYAIFNPLHTWIEFLNRLLGALGGLATLVVGILSFWHWKKSKLIPMIAWGIIFGMGFQAWLGKTVVDSNLQPFKITFHMVMALVIIALLLYLYFISKENKTKVILPSHIKGLAIFALILTLVQIAMGTQVRQFVDEQIDLLGEGNHALWLDPAPILFYVHRSFSLLVTGLNIWLFLRLRKLGFPTQHMQQVLVLIGLEITSGILMYYFDFPFSSQPLHLLFASLLFGAQSYLLFHLFQPTQSTSK